MTLNTVGRAILLERVDPNPGSLSCKSAMGILHGRGHDQGPFQPVVHAREVPEAETLGRCLTRQSTQLVQSLHTASAITCTWNVKFIAIYKKN